MASHPAEDFRVALAAAAEEARQSNAPMIGTEHLLLGALRQGDAAAVRLLAEEGVTFEGVYEKYRSDLRPSYPSGPTDAVQQRDLLTQFTPKAAEAMQRAQQMAGTNANVNHLLIALLETRGVSSALLPRPSGPYRDLPRDVDRRLAVRLRQLLSL